MEQKRWRLKQVDEAIAARLREAGSLSPIAARLLALRGVGDPESASFFVSPVMAGIADPFLLKGMEPAVTRLLAAMEARERVCIYGDYDVDGITSVALLMDFFSVIGLDAFYYIPRRLEEGYGLSAEGIDWAASHGADIIVSVDCGITAVAEAAHSRSVGIDLIITDHHLPGPQLPEAVAIINPLQPGCSFPFKHPAGVGLAFNLAIALRAALRQRGHFDRGTEPDLRALLDLVALGTIADVVPLVDENRVFVRYGLRQLTAGTRTGIRALKKVAGVDGEVTCGAVGFRLAPRLNAAGRLQDAAPGVELLLTRDPRLAEQLAAELDAGNAERQGIEQEILREAMEMVRQSQNLTGRKSIVLASENWHPGVIGIVASRIVDLYHRPTILIALNNGNGRGSGRSIAAFHLHDALHACSEHLVRFGGHRHAAGLTIEEETLEAFVESFDAVAEGTLTPDDLLPELHIDAELLPSHLTFELAEEVEQLAPFGMGNAEPVFTLPPAKVLERRILKDKHLKLRIDAEGKRLEAIGFNMAGRQVPDEVEVAFSLQINAWNGKKTLQLKLKDLRPPEPQAGDCRAAI